MIVDEFKKLMDGIGTFLENSSININVTIKDWAAVGGIVSITLPVGGVIAYKLYLDSSKESEH